MSSKQLESQYSTKLDHETEPTSHQGGAPSKLLIQLNEISCSLNLQPHYNLVITRLFITRIRLRHGRDWLPLLTSPAYETLIFSVQDSIVVTTLD